MSGNSILMEYALKNLSANGKMIFAGNQKKEVKLKLILMT